MRLVLASTSPYRRELLERLRLPFDVARPEADETPRPGEAPSALAARLAAAKAAAIAALDPAAWVLGSDQVAELDGVPLGKPGGRDAAIAQLTAMSGRTVAFHTGVCLLRAGTGRWRRRTSRACSSAASTMPGSRATSTRSSRSTAPAASSPKASASPCSRRSRRTDPTALVGLPLIATARLLRQAGFALP